MNKTNPTTLQLYLLDLTYINITSTFLFRIDINSFIPTGFDTFGALSIGPYLTQFRHKCISKAVKPRQLPGPINGDLFRQLANCFLLFCSDLAVFTVYITDDIDLYLKTQLKDSQDSHPVGRVNHSSSLLYNFTNNQSIDNKFVIFMKILCCFIKTLIR